MTKEELEKEAEKYFKSICEDYNEEYERTGKRHYFVGFDIKNGYLAGAEPREKRIAELEEKLANADYQLEGRDLEISELEAQIEKMKSASKTAYIKGIRTMANALKEYDRTEGSWTDYFEHTVDKVLKNLLKELAE